MVFIKCKKCGKEISDTLKNCSHFSYISIIVMLWIIFMYKLNGEKIFKNLSTIFIIIGIAFHVINGFLAIGYDTISISFDFWNMLNQIFDYDTICNNEINDKAKQCSH